MVSRLLAATAVVVVLAMPAAAATQAATTTPANAGASTSELAPIVPVPSDTGAATTPPVTPPVETPPVTTPPVTTGGDAQLIGSSGTGGVSTIPHPRPWIVLVAVWGGLLLLLLLAVGFARWRAWDPPWLRRARHSCAEASWRLGNTWSEFTDWVRLGR